MDFHKQMKNHVLIALSLVIAGVTALSGAAGAETAVPNTETWDLIRQSYIFSFPLMIMDATKTVSTNTVEPTKMTVPFSFGAHGDLSTCRREASTGQLSPVQH